MGDLLRLLLMAVLFALGAWAHLEFEARSIQAAREAVRSRDWSRALHVGALVLALGATVAASNTGYLGRLSDRSVDVLRFRLVHQVLTPGVLAAALVSWLRLNRVSE